MTGSNLSKQDYCKVLRFLYRIQSARPEDYRKQVLISLANIFNFNLTTFWLADKNGDMVAPITLSVDKHIMDSFQNKYYKYDLFYPKNLPKRLLNKNVITISDLTTKENYQNNIFYKDILKSYKLSHKIMYVYKDNGKLLGASTFLRPENRKDFSLRDITLIETCLKYASKLLSNFLLLEDLDFQKCLFESLSNNSYTGLFILNHNFKITYSNSAAIDYCRKLFDSNSFENPINNFVNTFLHNNTIWRYGLTTTLYSKDNRPFSVKIVPQTNRPEKPQYLVFIQTEGNTQDPRKDENNDLVKNLTLRERELLIQVIKGRSNQEIASDLFISVSTVKSHLQSIFDKCNVSNRTSLCYKFNNLNILI